MSLAAARLAMMDRFAAISGVTVPTDPLPPRIEDKSVIVIPISGETTVFSRGKNGSVAVQSRDLMLVQYHWRVPAKDAGAVLGDVTAVAQALMETVWGEFVTGGGKFAETVQQVHGVRLEHVGGLQWNEWTFGCRVAIDFTHLTEIT